MVIVVLTPIIDVMAIVVCETIGAIDCMIQHAYIILGVVPV